jgi:hypothetical protein
MIRPSRPTIVDESSVASTARPYRSGLTGPLSATGRGILRRCPLERAAGAEGGESG